MTETAALTKLLINPDHVWLVTGKRRKRWLTDRYVIFDVTAAAAVQELPDGEYKLTKRGLTRIEDDAPASIGRGKLPQVDNLVIDRYRDATWLPLRPTPWLRQFDGSNVAYLARLCYTGEDGDRQPVVLSAAVLDAAVEFYDGIIVEKTSEETQPARFSRARGRPSTLGYVMPARFDGDGEDEDAAWLISEEALSQP